MHHAVGILALVAAITFAFGETTARVLVGLVLIAGAACFAFVAFLIITGSI